MSEQPQYCTSCGGAKTRRAGFVENSPWLAAMISFIFATLLIPEGFPAFWWYFDYWLRLATLFVSVLFGIVVWFIARDVRLRFRLKYGYTLHKITR